MTDAELIALRTLLKRWCDFLEFRGMTNSATYAQCALGGVNAELVERNIGRPKLEAPAGSS